MPRVSGDYYENKKKQIIDAAWRVCTAKPVTSVEMKDIIAETGFSHGVIYRYYKDLDEVLHDLVITINRQYRIDGRLDEILGGKADWQTKIRDVCSLLASQITEAGIDVLKISIYSDMFAMSDPERALAIASKIGRDEQSPLLSLVSVMSTFLSKTIKENNFTPVRSVDEIIQFMIVTYHGAQTGYVLSGCFNAEQVEGKYRPESMFSCLADSVISLIQG